LTVFINRGIIIVVKSKYKEKICRKFSVIIDNFRNHVEGELNCAEIFIFGR